MTSQRPDLKQVVARTFELGFVAIGRISAHLERRCVSHHDRTTSVHRTTTNSGYFDMSAARAGRAWT